jgi:hypothetical protein
MFNRFFAACLVTTMVACTTFPSFGENAEEMMEAPMSDSVQVELSGIQLTITIDDLERLKGELLVILEQREDNELNKRLVDELHIVAPKISQDNQARIGGWKLIVRDHAVLLQCLAILHENYRLYYEADLGVRDKHWQVIQIREYIVRRQGV